MKLYLIVLIIATGTSPMAYIGKVQMTDFKLVKKTKPAEVERKALMITNGFASTDNSMYTAPPTPTDNFVYSIPLQVGTYYPTSATTAINYLPDPANYKAPQANVRFINNGGSQQAMMPTNQYNQLFNNANSNQLQSNTPPGSHDLANQIYKNTKTNIDLGRKNSHTLATVGANLLTNYMKLGSSMMDTARNGAVALYAEKKSGDLTEAAATAIDSAQQQQVAIAKTDPNNLSTPSLPPTSSMYTSSYGRGYRDLI